MLILETVPDLPKKGFIITVLGPVNQSLRSDNEFGSS